MTDAAVVHRYLLGIVAALVVVVVAGTVAVRIVDHARAILASVTRARRAVEGVDANVSAIPALATTASTADRILVGALGIEAKVRLVADALEERSAPAMRVVKGGR